jgi:hypothetical protein
MQRLESMWPRTVIAANGSRTTELAHGNTPDELRDLPGEIVLSSPNWRIDQHRRLFMRPPTLPATKQRCIGRVTQRIGRANRFR